MSELKYQLMLNKDMSWVPCYLKSEYDKVITDLEESHKMEVEQLLMEIAELKETLNNSRNARKYWRKECSHQKYKRCLANANVCAEKLYRQNLTTYGYEFYCKWLRRWLKIAEQFKEAK